MAKSNLHSSFTSEPTSPENLHYYNLLYQLASQAKWICRPNPAVAALVVRNGKILSWGYTQPVGGDHAESQALKKIGRRAQGAELYVTLMPCCFQGRTQACTDVIIRSGIEKVHVAGFDNDPRMIDPHSSLVNPHSIRALQKAGISLDCDCPPNIAEKLFFLNWDYFKRNETGLPTITMKYAMTLDGKIAGPPKKTTTANRGETQITGKSIAKQNHFERARHDAILIGGNTLRNDNPRLNVRIGKSDIPMLNGIDFSHSEIVSQLHHPTPIVLARSRQSPNLFLMKKKKPPQPIFIVPMSAKKWFPTQSKVVFMEMGIKKDEDHTRYYQGSPQDQGFWKFLAKEFGLHSIYFEGGAATQSYLWHTRLIDRVQVYIAPRLFGQEQALSPFSSSYTEEEGEGGGAQPSTEGGRLIDLWQPRITRWDRDLEISGFLNSKLAKKLWKKLFPML